MKDETVAFLTAHNVVQIWDTATQSLSAQYTSKENSILYSGLLVPLQDDVLVLAGTVFSEVIIHACKIEKPLHYLKGHKGVIFSISCNQEKRLIVTTSDDRSVRIWSVSTNSNSSRADTIEFWQKADITCTHELYGHTARVMRNCITRDMVVSVGEDSAICCWSFQGNLLRKWVTHQNGGIWSVDSNDEHLVTGGGDCGVIIHPLAITVEYGQNETLNLEVGPPKNILFTARKNVVILNECDENIHYDLKTKVKTVQKLTHESTYKLISLSSCKQLVAVVDMCGNFDVFIENCKGDATLYNVMKTKLEIGKILSMHWAGNRHLVLCCEQGLINVLASRENIVELYKQFTLPPCKERWLTAADIDSRNGTLVVGDRCGNIHVYRNSNRVPIKSFSKVHGRYGPTSITIKADEFITTGRDGTIKYFNLSNENKTLAKYMSSKDLEFQWVEKFIDKNENVVCGFQERTFIVYDIKNKSKLLNVECGGGHRSWDVVRYIDEVNDVYEEFIMLMYLKKGVIQVHKFQMSKVVSRNVISGSHSKEINCLISYRTNLSDSIIFYITGGEDTTLRISSIDNELKFREDTIFKHLSSVRTLKSYSLTDDKILVVSAGGRAQICIKIIEFTNINNGIATKTQQCVDYMIKGTEKERKGKQTWRDCTIDFDPETRIMDVDIIAINENKFIIFAGCSDATLRSFSFDLETADFKSLTTQKCYETCILKTKHVKFDNRNLIVTCTTRGEVTFWDIGMPDIEILELNPIFTMNTNKSASWASEKFHCSQITGLRLVDDFLLSTSIDQRVTLCKWSIEKGVITCQFVSQTFSDISDIQGMDILDNSR
ncbi:WD repeat-containing protein 6 [Achroia grisella]|uniref:WD repeat-containing protein 6 n=1 Tax=Achroia grisella TaxID=688607 RepID=UPI0027D31925|nr:WD repeat-containing protein 6 [Achroia grisella]